MISFIKKFSKFRIPYFLHLMNYLCQNIFTDVSPCQVKFHLREIKTDSVTTKERKKKVF